ncbi:MAG TPA: c-type cytochrome biogenesis protein CcmI [Acidiferrobacteraceae bacterium]|nr:c-type cytochrome biogenesis protein CcmI [Acidiferrobacteraceae bacterium]
MIIFWIIAAVMVAAALLLVLPTLLGRKRIVELDRGRENVHIAREHFAELEADLSHGLITQVQFEQAQAEVERVLLNDVAEDDSDIGTGITLGSRWPVVLIGLAVPVLAVGLYLYLGVPEAIDSPDSTARSSSPLPSVEAMTQRLVERLRAQPTDANAWLMLGRTYLATRRFVDATSALEKAHALLGDQPELLLNYANALAMSNNGQLAGKPFELIKKILVQRPKNPAALWLSGMAHYQLGENKKAIKSWHRLLPLLVDDPKTTAEVQGLIAHAQQRIDASKKKPATATRPQIGPGKLVNVNVSLDPRFKDEMAPTDTVFVFARAAKGPPMPLAVIRRQVKDLPLQVTLDDSMAIIPTMRISNHARVYIGARISRSGNATPQSGDLRTPVIPATPGQNQVVTLIIQERIP